MAEALIGGILASDLAKPQDVRIGEPVEARRSYLESEHGLKAVAKNSQAIEGADMVVLAVKPQNLPEILSELNGDLAESSAVVSIVAGATIATLTGGLDHRAVVRVMPNTPAQIGAGMSVWTATPEVPESVTAAT